MRPRSIFIGILCISLACRERYGLPMEAGISGSLVVEGNILTGDTTIIKLSRTSSVAERRLLPEVGATVSVEGNDNSSYFLSESEAGVYKIAPLSLNNSNRYRIRIISGAGEYESDWTEVMNTAEIDSVFWQRSDGVEIFVHSSGSSDESRYYKWDYEEVWDFYSRFKSHAYFTSYVNDLGVRYYECMDVFENGMFYNTCIISYGRSGNIHNDSMYHCWKYQNSTKILIGSAAALTENVIRAPVRRIEEDAFELTSIYSILVKQTALTKEGYEFYQILKGNSEGMGTIFDAQPSQLKTNVRCLSTPGEVVIGFVQATEVKSNRLFITSRQVPGWRYDPFTCVESAAVNEAQSVQDALLSNMVPTFDVVFERLPPFRVSYVSTASRFCVDCRMRGVHKRPPFWP